MLKLGPVFVLITLLISLANASFYGKNKVQNLSSDWRRIQTSHFNIYFNQEGDSVAQFTAQRIEKIYEDLSLKLDHKIFRRIPILLHNSPNHFRETNVIRINLPEAVGGFTEIFKNRIVLPFAGNWPEFAHVLKHELVHAMVFDMMRGPNGNAMSIARRLAGVPLWFSEGLAEWASNSWNINGEFFLIDAITNGYVPPPTYEFPGYLAYKGGHSFLLFISDNFGHQTIPQILKDIAKGYSINDAIRRKTKISLEELGELWIRELRRLYWPELGHRQYAKRISTPMIDHKETQSFLNATPSLSPDGKHMAYASDGGNWEGIFLQEIKTKETVQILKNGFISDHESLHLLSSGFDWSPDSKNLAFVSQKEGRDVLSIYNIADEEVKVQISTPYHSIRHPKYNADGTKIIFSAQSPTGSDLAYYDFKSKGIIQLTNDHYLEDDPVFSPDGKSVIFSTDRYRNPNDSLNPNKLDLVRLDLESNQTQRLTNSRWNSKSAAFDKEGKGLYFLSDRSGLHNLYHIDLTSKKVTPITNVLSSIKSFSYNSKKDNLAYSLFERGGWNIFLLEEVSQKKSKKPQPTHFINWSQNSAQTYFRPIEKDVLLSFQKSLIDSLKNDSIQTQNLLDENKDSIDVRIEKEIQDSTRNADSLKHLNEIYADTSSQFYSDTLNNYQNLSDFKIIDYEPEWSIDNATILAGVSAGNNANVSFGGQALITFSDLTGDHELNFQTLASGTSFDEIDISGAYRYLKHKIDYGLYAFHQANIVSEYILFDSLGNQLRGDDWHNNIVVDTFKNILPADHEVDGADTVIACAVDEAGQIDYIEFEKESRLCKKYDLFRDRSFGLGGVMSIPTSRFNRWDLSFHLSSIIREKYFINSSGELQINQGLNSKQLNFLHSALSWTFDNSRWGIVGPINGGRYGFAVETNIPFNQSEAHWIAHGDLRHYFRFFKRFTIANRLMGGVSGNFDSEGSTHQFLLGGDQPFSFNGHVNRTGISGNFTSRYQSKLSTPLRGFKYHDFSGRYTALYNVEFRFPFIHHLAMQLPVPFPAPFLISNVAGVIFSDIGAAWNSGDPTKGIGHGYGWGLRLNLGVFILRYTKAWTNSNFENHRPGSTDYWSIGAEF